MNQHGTTTRGRAFRRIGGAAVVTGAAVCAAAALAGPLTAEAIPPHRASHVGTSPAHPSTTTTTTTHPRTSTTTTTTTDTADAEIDAYYAAGYQYEDALDLAALWRSADRNRAKSEAGARLRAGQALPFAPGQGFTRSYTTAQQRYAFELAEGDDPGLAARLATAWKVSPATAEAEAGALVLANRPVPLEHPVPSAGDAAQAFADAGYGYTDAERLAQLWKVDAYSAKVRAGRDLLSTPAIALPTP